MANNYCTRAQLQYMYDARLLAMLSNDQNQLNPNALNLDFLLDMQASELDSHLTNRVGLPVASPVPLVLTKWVGVTAIARAFARRNDRPKEIDADLKWADEWLEMFDKGMIQIPGVDRSAFPALQDSDFVNGESRFDQVFGTSPSPTGPTSPNGQNIG